jgi:anti-sigma factor RsiW
MTHLSIENIIAYRDGKATDAEKSSLEAHLAICADCAESKRQIETLDTWLREDASFEPPGHLVERWMNVFEPVVIPKKTSLERIIASVVFDSFDQPMLADVRRPGTAARQRIFRAGDIDVDVKIESAAAGERITLAGQVLSGKSDFFDNAPVRLESQGVVRSRTRTNKMGEFSFEVANDTYHLSIELKEGEIVIFNAHHRDSSAGDA